MDLEGTSKIQFSHFTDKEIEAQSYMTCPFQNSNIYPLIVDPLSKMNEYRYD